MIVGFFACCVVYFILGLQVCGGFPPFYVQRSSNRMIRVTNYDPVADQADADMRRIIPYMAILGICAVVGVLGPMVGVPILFPVMFALAGAVAVFAGIRERAILRDRVSGPRDWMMHWYIAPLLERHKMLVFDVWTLGLTGLFGVMVF